MIQLFTRVDVDDPNLGWQVGYVHYNATTRKRRSRVLGPAWKNLLFDHWYELRMQMDFDRNRIRAVAIRDLHSGRTDHCYPPDWCLRGGSAGAPPPYAFRLFSGGAEGGNTAAWDNVCIGKVGDLNCDASVASDDINPFVLALSDPELYKMIYADSCVDAADCNGDGWINFTDINSFVALLSGD